MNAYYNENDRYKAAWLKNMIDADVIPKGHVDTRSIEDVRPADLDGYTQCHFFAGVGIWPLAFRLAGWPDHRPVWSGSCPCQPFSSAGKGAAFGDERHLWPAWFHLIGECRPDDVFAEQVASKDGLSWLDLVQADMEGTSYAGGFLDLCAAGFGAPHIRQRLYGHFRFDFVILGDTGPSRSTIGISKSMEREKGISAIHDDRGDRLFRSSSRQPELGILGDTDSESIRRKSGTGDQEETGVGDWSQGDADRPSSRLPSAEPKPGPTNGYWRDVDWLYCRDERWRPVEPGTFPLAHGYPERSGELQAYGDAIVLPQAVEFIRAVMT